MPEGDTIWQSADRLGPVLIGNPVRQVSGSHPAVRREGRRIVGCHVTDVRAVGKHPLVDVDRGWTLRTHLGMSGVWHVYPTGARWRRSPGAARVVLRTDDHEVVCFAAPTVQLGPTDRVLASIDHLGPDLMAADVDVDEVANDAAGHTGTVSDLLLDQSVMSGIGNVYKSEVLFLEGLDPAMQAASLERDQVMAAVDRARRLLAANRRPGPRVTTGSTRLGHELWVYGREGRPCRRCGSPISAAWLGDPARITYWCSTCQTDPSSAPS